MELSREVIEARAADYEAEEPLAVVESEQLEGLPRAFAAGAFGFRDAEWVLRWHYRRYLGDYPDDRRRAAEAAFGENDRQAVREAVATAVEAGGVEAKLARLTDLSGVDVPVATAFLQFVDPDRFVVIGEREWGVLRAAGELPTGYPDPPDVWDYRDYLAACRRVADREDVDLVTLHRALWRLSAG